MIISTFSRVPKFIVAGAIILLFDYAQSCPITVIAVVATLRQRLAPSLSVPTLSNPISTAFDFSSRLVTRSVMCFFGIFLKYMGSIGRKARD
jgi:hypothetical protein